MTGVDGVSDKLLEHCDACAVGRKGVALEGIITVGKTFNRRNVFWAIIDLLGIFLGNGPKQ